MTRHNLIYLFVLLPALLAFGRITQAQGVTSLRIEQGDPSIAYSGYWYTNESSLHSGGDSALTNAKGARATVSFTGTGITWIGLMDPWSGLATVFLDGTMYSVDSYSSDTFYQHRLFSAQGLTAAPHTLTIDVPHERGPNTSGSWVWIDAFEIENGSGVPGGTTAMPGRSEENTPALIYTGSWLKSSGENHSKNNAALATDPGSSATINFNGTGITWIAFGDEWSGIARVFLDGEFVTLVDTYASPANASLVAYSIASLSSKNHSLTIEVTGTHSQNSLASWIWIDAFDVVDIEVTNPCRWTIGYRSQRLIEMLCSAYRRKLP